VRFMPASSWPGRKARWKVQRRLRWLIPAAVAGASVVAAPIASAASGWTVVTVPQTANNTILNGASAHTASDVWAVGQQFVGAGQAQAPPVSYHWNGTGWSLIGTPSLGASTPGVLLGVSSASPSDAWAVGFSIPGREDERTLLEHWNGTAWSVDTSVAINGEVAQLTGVADISPGNAWAVGRGPTGTLLEHWNGTSWSAVTVPDPGFNPGSGESLSATSASDIWLAGTSQSSTGVTTAEALHYNGSTWSVVPMAQPGTNTPTISSVTALSASNAWAVGQDIGATSAVGGSTLIEHWNGQTWSVVPSPTPGGDPSLTAVAARGPSDVYAVGNSLPSINGGVVQGIILRWNGSTWSVDSDPTTGTYSPLSAAAAAPGAANEWAAGTLSSKSLILSHG
jgi:hypothetical protein